MSTTFYFSYAGSKKDENHEIAHLVTKARAQDKPFDKVVEVFGGSLAFSRYLWGMYGQDITYLTSDADGDLTSFCNEFYADKQTVLEMVKEKSREIMSSPDADERKAAFKAYYNNVPEGGLEKLAWFLLLKKNSIMGRMGFFNPNRRMCVFQRYEQLTAVTDDFFKNGTVYANQDFKVYLEQAKNDPTALVYLDPPYIGKCNAFYKGKGKGLKEIFDYLHAWMMECKCKYILVHSDCELLRQWIKDGDVPLVKTYEKEYKINHNKVTHLVISNI
jgi:site-specific DNA-adenine methylase